VKSQHVWALKQHSYVSMEFHHGSTCTNNVDWFQVFDYLLGLRTEPHKFTLDETHNKTSLKSKNSPRFKQGLGLGNVKVN
jgi:hypothetical protein